MPTLFSYGTLQQTAVQLSTFGRALEGEPAELAGFELAVFTVLDPVFVAESGKADHAIVRFTGRPENHVAGTALEVTEKELTDADSYEPAGYIRISATLTSGKQVWVYAQQQQQQQQQQQPTDDA